VGVLIREGDRYLMVKRGAEPDAGLWSIPGGLVEVGERTSYAAAREAKEETGLDVDIVDVLGVVDKIVRDEARRVKYHFVIIDYLAEPRDGSMRAASDALEARWVNAEELTDYELTPTLVELLKRVGIYPDL
jgi:8-oxo-dGTP diphosphatase